MSVVDPVAIEIDRIISLASCPGVVTPLPAMTYALAAAFATLVLTAASK